MKTAPVIIRIPDLKPSLDEAVSSPVESVLDSIVATPPDEVREDETDSGQQPVETVPASQRRQRRRQQRRELAKTTSTWKTLIWPVSVGGLMAFLLLIGYVLLLGGRTPNNSANNDDSKGLDINMGQRLEKIDDKTGDDDESLPNRDNPPPMPPAGDGLTQPEQRIEGPDFTYESPLDPPQYGDGKATDDGVARENATVSFPYTIPSNSYTYPVTNPNKHQYPNSMAPDFAPPLRTGRREPEPNDGAKRSPSRDGRTRTAYLPGQIELQHGGTQR